LGCTQLPALAPGAAVAFSEAAGAGDAALLGGAVEDVLGGAVALGVTGACAQIGMAIARTAASATPLNKCFIVQPPTQTCEPALSIANREAVRVSFNG
jgi:hypothetical protein